MAMPAIDDASQFQSQFMQHMYEPEYFMKFDKHRLARALYERALAENPNLETLAKEMGELQKRYGHGAEYVKFKTTAQEAEINALASKIVAGEIPMPLRANAATDIEKIALSRAEIRLKAAEIDKVFSGFEGKFFETDEGRKFAAYIEASKADDFTAFKQAFSEIPTEPPSAASLNKDAAVAEESWVSKIGKSIKEKPGRAAAIATGAAVVIGGGAWALGEMNKRQENESKPKQL